MSTGSGDRWGNLAPVPLLRCCWWVGAERDRLAQRWRHARSSPLFPYRPRRRPHRRQQRRRCRWRPAFAAAPRLRLYCAPMPVTVLWNTRDWSIAIADLPADGPLPCRTALVPRGRVAHALRRELIRIDRADALVGTRFVAVGVAATPLPARHRARPGRPCLGAEPAGHRPARLRGAPPPGGAGVLSGARRELAEFGLGIMLAVMGPPALARRCQPPGRRVRLRA